MTTRVTDDSQKCCSEQGSDGNDAGRVSDVLAVRPKVAARMLGIGERLLWSMTNRGEIPHVRAGKAVLYPVDGLRGWLADQTRQGGRR